MMYPPIKKKIVLSLLSSLVILTACGEKKESASEEEARHAQDATTIYDPSVVKANATLNKQIKVEAVKEKTLNETLRVTGKVSVNDTAVAKIGSNVTGRLLKIQAILGQDVKKGEVLAILNSTELGTAQMNYLKAMSDANLKQRAVERAQVLIQADVIATAELQKRESERDQAEIEKEAAADQLRVIGMSAQDIQKLARTRKIHSVSPIISTVNGTIIERKVTEGQVVQPSDLLYTVADLDHVWVVAEVPEQQAEFVHEGDLVEAEIPALNNAKFEGKLVFVGDTVNPETRTVTVRMDILNLKHELKPAMLANMLIQGKPKTIPVVPASAVIRENNKDYVFVILANGQYRLREVTLDSAIDDMRRIRSGLKVGEKIVIDGAFHLNNARNAN